jgi:hypothetical protein
MTIQTLNPKTLSRRLPAARSRGLRASSLTLSLCSLSLCSLLGAAACNGDIDEPERSPRLGASDDERNTGTENTRAPGTSTSEDPSPNVRGAVDPGGEEVDEDLSISNNDNDVGGRRGGGGGRRRASDDDILSDAGVDVDAGDVDAGEEEVVVDAGEVEVVVDAGDAGL